MEVFGIMGFCLGSMGMTFEIVAFAQIQELKKQIEKLEQEITEIKK